MQTVVPVVYSQDIVLLIKDEPAFCNTVCISADDGPEIRALFNILLQTVIS